MRVKGFTSVVLLGVLFHISICQFTKDNKEFYRNLYIKTIKQSSELQNVAYSVLGLKSLNKDIDKHISNDICKKVTKLYENELMSVQALFYLGLISENLDKCNIVAPKDIESFLDDRLKDQKSIKTLYEIDRTHKSFKLKPKNREILEQMKEALDKDPSVNNLAYFLKFANENWGIIDTDYAKKQIQSLLSQSDEVDGKYLQFDGGIAITSLIIDLLYKFSASLPDIKILTEDRSLKFTNNLLYHKSQINTKNAYFVYKAIKSISSSKTHVSVLIMPHFEIGQATSLKKPIVKISVSNIMGKSISENNPLHISAKISSYSDPHNKELIHTVSLKPSSAPTGHPITGKNTWYEVNIMELNLPTSQSYNMLFEIQAPSTDIMYYGLKSGKKVVKITKDISIQDVIVQVVDKAHETHNKKISLKENTKHSNVLEVGIESKLIMNFILKEIPSNNECLAQQVFVKFTHKKTKHEAIFVAEPKGNTKVYEFDLNVGSKSGKDFNNLSGDYMVELLVGDRYVSNSIAWNMVDCHLTFPHTKEIEISETHRFTKKPEIKHLFKVPEKRPPAIVSLIFSILTILPAFLMIGLWVKLGVNFSKFKISLWSLVFHVSLAAMLGLYGLFWLKLNMFQTLRYMTMIGPVLFYSGNRLLHHLACQRKKGDY